MADEALGRVCHEADPTAGSADAGEFARRLLLVWGEHRAED
jgi:hypothetical protein